MSDNAKAFDLRLLARVWKYVRPHWVLLASALALITIVAAVEMAIPYLLKVAIDAHIAVHRMDGLITLSILFAVATLVRGVTTMGLGLVLNLLGHRSMHDLRCALHAHVLGRNAAFFDRTPVGSLMSAITNDIDNIYGLFTGGVVTLAADVAVLLSVLGAMLYLSVSLTLVTLLCFPLLVPLFTWLRKLMQTAFRELRARVSELTTYAVERISGVATVQTFCHEPQALREYGEIGVAYRKVSIRAFLSAAVPLPVTESIAVISSAVILWKSGVSVGRGAVTVGLVVAFIEYSNRFFGPIYALAQKYLSAHAAMAAAERVFALLDRDEADAPPLATPVTAVDDTAPALELRDVRFAYRESEDVLHGVSFSVPRGSTVAVVGATGSGKSTLVRLLARYYQPRAGEVRVDGRDVRAWPIGELRQRVTVIAQDVFLFTGTVAENVRLGRADASDREIEAVLERVGARKLLERPNGIDAEIAERGTNLSTGERQLICFARALIRNPEVLLLDEATAHVDPETEQTIERALTNLFAGRTSLIVAHRLSTIRRADRIIVMAQGQIVETGTRDELLAANGAYARLEQTGKL